MTAQTCADPEGGQGVRTPSRKSQVICVFMEISIWTPPPPWKCWTPPPCKMLDPPCITVKSVESFKKTLLRLFFGSRASPSHTPSDKDSWIRASQRNSNRISETFKLCARKCRDNIKGHLQTFSDSYISQLWYYRFFFYPTDIPSPHIG